MTIMEKLAKFVEFLGLVLGDNCEIVLLDLNEDKRQITAIANGHISGRQVGAPLTDYAMRVLANGIWKSEDYQCNYPGITRDNRMLRSSTFFVKEGGQLVGMLCINIDAGKYKELSETILKLGGILSEAEDQSAHPVQKYGESFSDSVEDIVGQIIQTTVNENGGIPTDRLTQDEKLDIIKHLNDIGVFLLKGAISEVAKQLSCSEASVYRYLSIVNKHPKTMQKS